MSAKAGDILPGGLFVIEIADYELLLEHAEADDMVVRCEVCNAWLSRADEATASADDFTGCWKAATGGDEKWSHLCRSYRAIK